MPFVLVLDVFDQEITTIPCGAPPSAELLETMIKFMFPALTTSPFALSLRLADGTTVPYAQPDPSAFETVVILHRPGTISEDVERGDRMYVDPTMIQSSTSTPTGGRDIRNTSCNVCGASTPVSSPRSSTNVDFGDTVLDALNNRQLCEDLQPAMREWCLRRDQACIVTAELAPALLECAHVLKPVYAMKWFNELRGRRMYMTAACPELAGRSTPAMDVRNGVMMSLNAFKLFDRFAFSIYLDIDDGRVIFVFNRNKHEVVDSIDIRHGAEILTPRVDERFPIPTYFTDLFPDPAVFMEHFLAKRCCSMPKVQRMITTWRVTASASPHSDADAVARQEDHITSTEGSTID
ncbi:hypothetical protein HDU85_003857 [Gaertneriomyces sp. JEL0708]|nr:hypothetical protein HDU85_003857 [Gaertneriomyces sp. JEL0708]